MSEIWIPERRRLALASCEKWHGTPHQDRIAIVKVGIDCAQLVHEILCDSGIIEPRKFTGYNLATGMHSIVRQLERTIGTCLNVEEVDKTNHQFGDIPVFREGIRSGHVGFCTEHHIWHSMANRFVTKSEFKIWRGEIQTIFRIKEIGWLENPQTIINA